MLRGRSSVCRWSRRAQASSGALALLLLASWATPAPVPAATQDPDVRAAAPQDPPRRAAEQDPPPRRPPPHFEPFPVRWFAPGRPVDGIEPPPYEINTPAEAPLNPYRQNPLKGDFPVLGTEDLFVNFTLTNRTIFQYRELPTPAGITGPGPVSPDFFGKPRQTFLNNDLAVTVDLFKGQQAFKPVDWRIKVTPVFNYSDLRVQEVGVVKVDVTRGRTRREIDFALQEAFVEYHIADLSDRYDFLSVEAGILPFRSDFRGFIFDDVNLGVRFLANADENKWQFNVAAFDMLDKDTNSLLNNTDSRDQQIVIANLYRQDWPVLGYTTSLSFHYNHDERGFHFDDNGVLVSPAPIGRAQENELEVYYAGWAGEGHIGRFNITHAYYHAFGRDSLNPFAARDVSIEAHFAALELSYDIDWWRVRLFGMYASGDDDARDSRAEGFDAILDAPNFAGGDFSFFNSQAIRLLGVNLTNFQSPLPDLQSNKFEGHANFVNPGLLQFGAALDFELTPKTRALIGGSHLQFMETDPLEVYLELDTVDREIGTEAFIGAQYRPLLNNNVVFIFGANALFPGEGFERIYQSDDLVYSTFVTTLLNF